MACIIRPVAILGMVLLLFPTVVPVATADVAPPDFRQKQSDEVWEKNIRKPNFGDRQIIEGAEQNLLEIKAPYTAEDATVVPVSIHISKPQSADQYIKRIHVFVDKNPVPLVGEFEFTPQSGRADLAMRIRVDDFSYVRAIAETNTGELYMAKNFVRAKGACSAPPPASMEDSRKLLGQMKMRTVGDLELGKPNLMQLKIRHPNITGLAPLKIGSHVRPPAHFVNNIEVDYNGKLIMKAKLTFSVSMDPAFRFYFIPDEPGIMTVKGVDTKKNEFSSTHEITVSS